MKNGSTMNRGELTGNCPVSGGYKEPVLPDLGLGSVSILEPTAAGVGRAHAGGVLEYAVELTVEGQRWPYVALGPCLRR
jgi:hypothetical protein